MALQNVTLVITLPGNYASACARSKRPAPANAADPSTVRHSQPQRNPS